MMDAQPLRECIEQEWGRVALVKVRKVQALQQGSRGAKVLLEVEVERVLHGAELKSPITIQAWGGPDFAQTGRRYIVAIDGRGPTPSQYILFGVIEASEGEEEAAVRAHQELIATLKTQIERDTELDEQ
ncbi:MAG: hypothetical protein JXB05_24390 [Myxococcaceae bacterium]|nr:hypothetical protein [Myxococcaceae bacterium]